MKDKAKSRIALALAAALALGAVGALSSMTWLTERATNLDPDPNGVEAIGAEDEAAGENDGPGGVDWGYWQSVNPDIIGWIAVPGTGIDYPIVQAHEGDPDHYLRYDVYGGWNYHGVPYLHWKCADDGLLGAGNALVFGHHLNDGTMFSALARFSNAGYAEGHSPIILQTPEGDAGLRVLAVDVVDASREGAKVEFADDAEHAQWLARVVADADLSLVGEGFDCSSVKSVVTLCTCSYNRWGNERTLVICAVDALG